MMALHRLNDGLTNRTIHIILSPQKAVASTILKAKTIMPAMPEIKKCQYIVNVCAVLSRLKILLIA